MKGEPEPSWQRAALSFLVGMAAMGSGAAAGAALGRRRPKAPPERPTQTRGERITMNAAILMLYAGVIAGGLLGWKLSHSFVGAVVGTMVGPGLGMAGGLVVFGIQALVKVIRR